MMADVPGTQRAENRIGNRMNQHIGIRMPVQPLPMRYLDAAKKELPALDQLMNVISDSYAIHGAGDRSANRRDNKVALGG